MGQRMNHRTCLHGHRTRRQSLPSRHTSPYSLSSFRSARVNVRWEFGLQYHVAAEQLTISCWRGTQRTLRLLPWVSHVQGCGTVAVNAKLPSLLAERDISFLGPTGSEMQRVRDRAANLIIAQTLGIRTLPWSGSGIERDAPAWSSPRDVTASEAARMALGSPIVVDPALIRRACVASVEEALSRAEKITYPVWLHLAVPTHGAHIPHPAPP
jgi:hypothetical protein